MDTEWLIQLLSTGKHVALRCEPLDHVIKENTEQKGTSCKSSENIWLPLYEVILDFLF